MEVSVAVPGDEGEIAEVHVRTWQGAYRGQVPDAYLDGLAPEQRIEVWRHLISESDWPTTGAFVLRDEGRIVGFAHVCPSRDDDAKPGVGELSSIYVHPDHWNKGGGRALMDAAIESLRLAGCSSATLWVLDTNARAQRFYELGQWTREAVTKVEDRGTFVLRECRYRLELEGLITVT